MKKQAENKAILPQKNKEVKNKYFFPDDQVTVEAETMEEAQKKLKKQKEK